MNPESVAATVNFAGIIARAADAGLGETKATLVSLKVARGELLAQMVDNLKAQRLAAAAFFQMKAGEFDPIIQAWDARYAELKQKKPASAVETFL